MRKTSCKAHMIFADVTALEDSAPSTNNNQRIADIGLLKKSVTNSDYATLEFNQFLLDGSKEIISDNTNNIAFMSSNISSDDCLFVENPVVSFSFSQNHTSAGITLDFGFEYPAKIIVTWYTLKGEKLLSKEYAPGKVKHVCRQQVENYGRIDVEFVQTRFPKQYAKLQSVLFGIEIEWTGADITSAKITEDMDVTSSTLAINTSTISIIDKNNDFDIENDNGAWKAVQKSQEVVLTEYIEDEEVPCGVFFINEKSFSKNIASFELIDRIGLMDNYIFDQGEMYSNKPIGEIIETIFACANVTEYEISENIYNLVVSGTLEIQTCREALQMCCFVVGAVADDSRSGVIRVYAPDRYIKQTIPVSRKFDGSTSVSLKEYVSGISITGKQYSLAEDNDDIYDNILSKGKTRINFSDPHIPDTITATAGKIIEAKTFYAVIDMTESGQCKIQGKKYDSSNFTTVAREEYLDSNEVENIKEFGDITLYNADIVYNTAKKLLNYYSLRKSISLKYILEKENVGEWCGISNAKGVTSISLIENQNIDLAGGFIATASCTGYSVIVTDYNYTGTELYAGGNVL